MVRPEDRAAVASPCDHRLFITRNPRRLRFIENNAEAGGICQEMSFEVLDFDELTLSEQIQALGQARYVVGVHGAGLANMLFRGGHPLGLLGIYPPATYFPFYYILWPTNWAIIMIALLGCQGRSNFRAVSEWTRPSCASAELRQRRAAPAPGGAAAMLKHQVLFYSNDLAH